MSDTQAADGSSSDAYSPPPTTDPAACLYVSNPGLFYEEESLQQQQQQQHNTHSGAEETRLKSEDSARMPVHGTSTGSAGYLEWNDVTEGQKEVEAVTHLTPTGDGDGYLHLKATTNGSNHSCLDNNMQKTTLMKKQKHKKKKKKKKTIEALNQNREGKMKNKQHIRSDHHSFPLTQSIPLETETDSDSYHQNNYSLYVPDPSALQGEKKQVKRKKKKKRKEKEKGKGKEKERRKQKKIDKKDKLQNQNSQIFIIRGSTVLSQYALLPTGPMRASSPSLPSLDSSSSSSLSSYSSSTSSSSSEDSSEELDEQEAADSGEDDEEPSLMSDRQLRQMARTFIARNGVSTSASISRSTISNGSTGMHLSSSSVPSGISGLHEGKGCAWNSAWQRLVALLPDSEANFHQQLASLGLIFFL